MHDYCNTISKLYMSKTLGPNQIFDNYGTENSLELGKKRRGGWGGPPPTTEIHTETTLDAVYWPLEPEARAYSPRLHRFCIFTSRPSAQQHILVIPFCSHTLRILYKLAAAIFFSYFQASGKNLNFSRRLHKRSRNSPLSDRQAHAGVP